jgi:transcriptional regulator with XRE-family HTH domain
MEKTLNIRLKEARKALGMSQGYVANLMDLHRSVITAIELGTRKVTSDELKVFSELYGLTMDELMYGTDINVDEKIFARSFSELSEIDKKEILNLIEFKNRLKKATL